LRKTSLRVDSSPTSRIDFVPYSPLGHGFLTGQVRSTDDLAADDWRKTNPRFTGENFQCNLSLADEVAAIAAEAEVTPAQVALAWLLAQGDDIAPIPGTKRVSGVEENIAADGIELTADQLAKLTSSPGTLDVTAKRLRREDRAVLVCRSTRTAAHPTDSVGRLTFGVVPLGFVELVLEGDDAARGVDGGALVDQFPDARRDAQLMARVAPVPAGGALRCDQAGLIEAAQKTLGGTEHLRGPAHGVRGIVVVVELVGPARAGGIALVRNHSASTSQGTPDTSCGIRGPRVGFHHCQPTVRPASCTRVVRPRGRRYGDRLLVTENHLPIR
jgi:hypothetical protein